MASTVRSLSYATVGFVLIVGFQNCGPSFKADVGSTSDQSLTASPKLQVYPQKAFVSSSTVEVLFEIDPKPVSGKHVVEYSLNGSEFAPVQSYRSLSLENLGDGLHTAQLKLRDVDSDVELDSAAVEFTVDTQLPTAMVNEGPSPQHDSTSAVVVFSTADALSGVESNECSLDNSAFASCSSPLRLQGLASSTHTLKIRALDRAGNLSALASLTWTVDLGSSNLVLGKTPNAITNTKAASFEFMFDPTYTGPAGIVCSLDGSAFGTCTSPMAFTNLADGVHIFRIKPSGAANSLVKQYSWTVDSTPPSVVIGTKPASKTTSNAATFSFIATDIGVGVQATDCQWNDQPYATCTSPLTLSNLAVGQHSFRVRARDRAGNMSLVNSVSWEVEAEAEGPPRPSGLTLSQNFGYTKFTTSSNHQGKVIDASRAIWKLANSFVPFPTHKIPCENNNPNGPNLPTNTYPIMIDHPGITFVKPLIDGDVSLESGWGPNYCNSAAIMITSARDVVVDGARIDRAWDAFRPRSGSHGFHIKNSWVSSVRDDCVENDSFVSGKISNTLFDGCFAGFSMRGSPGNSLSGANQLLEIEDVLIRIRAFHFIKVDGRDEGIASGHVFKIQGSAPGITMHNSIIAYETPKLGIADQNITTMMGKNSNKIKSCSNNKLLWMQDTPLPSAFKDLAPCFKVYTGATARTMWREARCQWIRDNSATKTRRHPGDELECQP